MREHLSVEKVFAKGALACVALFGLTLSSNDPESFPYPTNTPIVAMGDSFAAGTGAGDYLTGTDTQDNRCRRSEHAPVAQIATEFGLSNVTNIACRGASPSDIFIGQYNEPNQLQSLSPNTEVVVLSIGGNLINLNDLLRDCEQSCPADSGAVLSATEKLQSDEFQQELQDTYQTILGKAPKATLYVTLYPKPIVQRPLCPTLINKDTDRFIGDFIDLLNEAIIGAISQLDSPRAVLVPAPAGIDACASFFTGVTLNGADPGHPTQSTAHKIGDTIVEIMWWQQEKAS